jgi:two-component system chemotaxis response regulator CheY
MLDGTVLGLCGGTTGLRPLGSIPRRKSDSMRALIVDDSKMVRMILGKLLRELEFDVLEAGDGQEAIERLYHGETVDLMLVDWNMPVMDGYELLCAVRANVLLSDIKVMMVTTESSIEQVQKALAAGANEYLMKPFTKELLHEKLVLMGVI